MHTRDIPIVGRLMGAVRAGGGHAEAAAARPRTILLVEDEPAVRGLFGQALRKAGYHVVEARNGAEALWMVDRGGVRADLLLSDVRMPYLEGPALGRQLQSRCPGLKLLFVSGYATAVDPDLDAVLLQKPFLRDDLMEKVRGLIGPPVPLAAAGAA